MTLRVEEIVEQLDELVRLGQDEYTGPEMAEELRKLVDMIRPARKEFSQMQCDAPASHNEHLWKHSEVSYYCAGVELD